MTYQELKRTCDVSKSDMSKVLGGSREFGQEIATVCATNNGLPNCPNIPDGYTVGEVARDGFVPTLANPNR